MEEYKEVIVLGIFSIIMVSIPFVIGYLGVVLWNT